MEKGALVKDPPLEEDRIILVQAWCIKSRWIHLHNLRTEVPHVKTTIVDLNEQRIAKWNSEDLPICRPALNEVVKRGRCNNLFSSTVVQGAIKEETASVHLRNHLPEVPPREVHDCGPERAARRGMEL